MHTTITQSIVYLNDYMRLMARHAKTIHSPEERKLSAENLMEIDDNIKVLTAYRDAIMPRPGEVKQEIQPEFVNGFYVKADDARNGY